MEAFPNPERKGCPGENTIKALAEDRLPADDPARVHLGSCSECYAEYRHYRLDWEQLKSHQSVSSAAKLPAPLDLGRRPHESVRPERGLKKQLGIGIAASALVIVGGIFAYHAELQHRSSTPSIEIASSTPVDADVNLFNSPTLRGVGDGSAPLAQVALPAAVVHLSITLPRFSQSGDYVVAVSKDRGGQQTVAKGAGTAIEKNGKVGVHVALDLRSAQAGSYFLATIRGSDNGTYYYPLQVHR